MKSQFFYPVIALALLTTTLGGQCLAAEDGSFEDDERWFEVEIIVYKATHSVGLIAESWDTDVLLAQKPDLVDFLQPYEEIPAEDVLNASTNNLTNQSSETKSDAAVSQTASGTQNSNNTATSSIVDPENQIMDGGPISEEPFQLLAPELLQLTGEAKTLRRHPEYEVVFHQAWRQPVFGAKDAKPIRIAGGKDYSENYEFDGSKKLLQSDLDLDISNSFGYQSDSESDKNNSATNVASTTPLVSDDPTKQNIDLLKNDSDETTNMVRRPLPWVPEVDGSIQVYVNRYLHVKTDLYYRRPDKEEVEVIDLSLMGTALSSVNTPFDPNLINTEQTTSSDISPVIDLTSIPTTDSNPLDSSAANMGNTSEAVSGGLFVKTPETSNVTK